MKVAIIHSYYSSKQSSGENLVVDAQVKVLRENGITVLVIAAHTDELELLSGYKIRSAINVATGRGLSPLAELREFQPDVVHVHNLFPNWGTKWLDEWHGPVVATVHNFRPVCAAGTLFRDGKACTLCPDTTSLAAVKNACYRDSKVATMPLAFRNRGGVAGDRLLSRADQVITLSRRAQLLYERFGLAEEKTTVIPNFVEDAGFAPQLPGGERWVYIGRLAQEKGILKLIENWPRDYNLDVYGSGPLRSEVDEAAAKHKSVTFHGQLDHSQVASVLRSACGLVFPSEWAEGLPLIYAEALASGRAVVAKDGNSAADDVRLADSGVVFESWGNLRVALDEATHSAVQLGENARQRFETTFTKATWLNATLAAYQSARRPNKDSYV